MRARWLVAASLFASGLARAQPKPVDACVANFEEAQLKEKRTKLVEASELYGACADPKCPSLVRGDCEAKRAEIIRRIPTATITVRDASGRDVDAKIEVDGKPLTGDRTRARPIDPGEHVVRYTVEGAEPGSEKITLFEVRRRA